MQLSELLEQYTMKEISFQTNISNENLEKLFAKEFESIKKIKTFGFISIIEREYKADLSEMKEEARKYYLQFAHEPLGLKGKGMYSETKEKSKLFPFVIILLLGYASWYFLTQFDKKHLSELVPFIDESTLEKFVSNFDDKNTTIEALDISKVTEAIKLQKEATKTDENVTSKTSSDAKEVENNTSSESNSTAETQKTIPKLNIAIVPQNRLWFGLVDMATKKRDHFSIADIYHIDIASKSWLVATSSAPFSLKFGSKTQFFNNNQEHYFRMDKEGMKVLTKEEYVALGGWEQW